MKINLNSKRDPRTIIIYSERNNPTTQQTRNSNVLLMQYFKTEGSTGKEWERNN